MAMMTMMMIKSHKRKPDSENMWPSANTLVSPPECRKGKKKEPVGRWGCTVKETEVHIYTDREARTT